MDAHLFKFIMKPHPILTSIGCLLLTCSFTPLHAAGEWNRFRGPNGSGLAADTALPMVADDTSTLWKVPVGKGWSSPVLWGDLLILTEETGDTKRAVVALSARDGRELWRHEDSFQPHKLHRTHNSFASSTPFIDAERIYVTWSTGNIIQALALDHQGRLLWKNENVARYIHQHGTGASPVVADGVMVVRSEFNWEPEGLTLEKQDEVWPACIVGLDAATGKEVWNLEVPHNHNTFSTPVLRPLPNGQTEVLCANTGNGVTGINLRTGAVNWSHNPGYKQRSVGSGVLHDDFYFCTFGSGGGVKEVAAFDLKSGQPQTVDFEIPKGLPYTPSPLVIGDLMYLLGDGGIMRCVEFKTGKTIYEERVEGVQGSSKFFSSPIAADGRIYCGSQQGDLIVIKAGPKFERLAATKLDGIINATPAIADGRLFVRTAASLWCLGSKAAPAP